MTPAGRAYHKFLADPRGILPHPYKGPSFDVKTAFACHRKQKNTAPDQLFSVVPLEIGMYRGCVLKTLII